MLIVIFLLLLLTLISIKYCDWPSISAIFNVVWLISFTLIATGGNQFFPISFQLMCCVVLIGFMTMVIDIFAKNVNFNKYSSNLRYYGHLKIITLILISLLPFFIKYILTISDVGVDGGLLFRVRYATSQVGGRLGVVGAIALFSTFHAVTCLIYRKVLGRYWVSVALLLATSMQLLTAARTGLIILICASLIVIWVQNRKFNLFTTLSAGTLIFASFLITSSLRTSYASVDTVDGNGFFSQVGKLLDGLSLYLGSGPVAFSQIIESGSTITPDGYVWFNVLSSLGIAEKINSGVLPYVYVPMATNIYSLFFPYYLYGGWTLVIIVMMTISVVFSMLFRLALGGAEISTFVYAFGAAFLIQSPIGDGFIVGFPVWVQMFFYILLVYLSLPILLNYMRHK